MQLKLDRIVFRHHSMNMVHRVVCMKKDRREIPNNRINEMIIRCTERNESTTTTTTSIAIQMLADLFTLAPEETVSAKKLAEINHNTGYIFSLLRIASVFELSQDLCMICSFCIE